MAGPSQVVTCAGARYASLSMAEKLPIPDDLLPAEPPEREAEIEVTEQHMEWARKRWPDASDRQRSNWVRKSIMTKMMGRRQHPDDPNRSLFGGAQPRSGPKPMKALGARLVEEAESRYNELRDALWAPIPLGSQASDMERHRAADVIIKHVREEKKELREADAYARLTDDEARREYAKMLAEMVKTGDLSMDDIMASVVDGSAVEDADVIDEGHRLEP